MRILALDLATHTGWAFAEQARAPTSGTYRLPSTGEDIARFLHDFRAWLTGQIKMREPHLIVYESPILVGDTNVVTLRKLYSLAGQTELTACDHAVPVEEGNLSSIRAHFLGKDRPKGSDALKRAVIDECRRRGWNPTDHNAADALALLDYTRCGRGIISKPMTFMAQAPLIAGAFR